MTLSVESMRYGDCGGRHAPASPCPPLSANDQDDTDYIIGTDSPGLGYVHPRIVERLRHQLRAQTTECVMETFGISAHTWMKMRKGMPIRRSVAERLLRRVGVVG